MSSSSKPTISVQVRALVEFACRTGDLGGDSDFAGPSRALQGTRGHQQLQRSRPAGYQKEVRLVQELDFPDFVLRIQGRLDGLLVADNGDVLLEEIKTTHGSPEGEPDPLHWAQLKVYGAMYAAEHSLVQLTLRLTYFDLGSGRTVEHPARFQSNDLAQFFADATGIYAHWVAAHRRWCVSRNSSLASLPFPYAQYRKGQREFAVAVYRTIQLRERLFAEAPTGIGKTISALFPALKALGEGKLERIFYLTARGTARAVAEKALADLRHAGARLRSLTLTAKEKVCVQDGQPCDLQTCPLARGYFDRNKPAMEAALAVESLTFPVLDQVARRHQVCPFELALDVSTWVDVVICDYNYVFDPQVYLRRHFGDESRSYAFLIDEAHNLVDRSREMFSAEISAAEIAQVQRAVKPVDPRCARALNKLARVARALHRASAGAADPSSILERTDEPDLFANAEPPKRPEAPLAGKRRADDPLRTSSASTLVELPEELLVPLESALDTAENWLVRNEPAEFRTDLLELFFRLHTFLRTAQQYDERYRTVLNEAAGCSVKLFCVDPSALLREALDRGQAAVFFSATLSPLEYYRTVLGGAATDQMVRLASPFPPENLSVLVQPRLRTYLRHRSGTVQEVASAVGSFVQGRPGNYLVYLPSYQYLTEVQAAFANLYPAVRVRAQAAGMSEIERAGFLDEFTAGTVEAKVGFAVLGGVFGEGIDLVGERLIGAAVIGVGMPPPSTERDLIRDYFQEKIGQGFDYAYLFPGMNRVLQAVGRVIRSETDRGVVLLIDTRFAEWRYRRLFPPFWTPRRVSSDAEIRAALDPFWAPG